jgi:hypothetical protein
LITRVVVVGLAIFALMGAIKDGRLPRVSGLIGSCSVVQTWPDGSQLEACEPGRLEGKPDLSSHGCTSSGTVASREYWRCPARLVASQVGR